MTSTATDTAEVTTPTVVILGASGDLTRRLLFPALHRILALGRVGSDMRLVGYGIDDWTTGQFLAHLREGVTTFGDGVDEAVWAELSSNAAFVQGDLSDAAVEKIREHVAGPALFYLALPPGLFGQAASALGSAGLSDESHGWRRIVVEKPFGTSFATAAELQTQLTSHWHENQIYRIDHFLGKDTVQNMLVFRLANRFVESVWNSANISQVQITATETIGLEGRWRYYDKAGAMRDMLQNHLMQLFALCAMEPLPVWDAEVLRDHKVEVLRSVRPIASADVAARAVRGQYGAGSIAGEDTVAYRSEPNIDPLSLTETYAAVQLFVDNWRWQGVPFLLRSGKRLGSDITEIALQLRPAPSKLFPRPTNSSTSTAGVDADGADGAADAEDVNWIVLRLRPDETIEIDTITKSAGLGLVTERVSLSTTDTRAGGSEYTAYEQLLIDVFGGDRSLFIRGDEASVAWGIVQPVLDAWASGGEPVLYRAGSDGPPAPDGFFGAGQRWRRYATPANPVNPAT